MRYHLSNKQTELDNLGKSKQDLNNDFNELKYQISSSLNVELNSHSLAHNITLFKEKVF